MEHLRLQEHHARQIADDLWLVDAWHQGEPGVIGVYLLTGPAGTALIDVGPGATVDRVLAGIRAAGVDPAAIEHLVLTHIHLDHAGATGALLAQMPNARVYVHELGVPHLINPERLVSSARRIYGDEMHRLWGSMVPVPAERISSVSDGDELAVGGRTLSVLYTPGHAVHHNAFFDAERGEVFAGDVAGVRLEDIPLVRPPTPPPDLNLEQWYSSIQKLLDLEPTRLFLPHFGAVNDPMTHLTELRRRLAQWGDALLPGIRAKQPDAELARLLEDLSDAELTSAAGEQESEARHRYELAANYLMSAQGYVRYYSKHHPELLD